ncbi:IDS sulfatase, partial [Polyodon spathula]|nr:IDS sulfatase [Polyodon spathula]
MLVFLIWYACVGAFPCLCNDPSVPASPTRVLNGLQEKERRRWGANQGPPALIASLTSLDLCPYKILNSLMRYILLIVADDLRPGLVYFGDTVVKSPNIDQLLPKAMSSTMPLYNCHDDDLQLIIAVKSQGFPNLALGIPVISGWSLGERGEWAKYSNFDVALHVPLIIYVPGTTASIPKPGDKTIPFLDPFQHTPDTASKVSELAGLTVPPPCQDHSFHVELCTEGFSLGGTFGSNELKTNAEAIAYSQYPRPADLPQHDSDLPLLRDTRIRGYSICSCDYHYTEWVGFNLATFRAPFQDVHAGELYFVATDPNQDKNLYNITEYTGVVQRFRSYLEK